MGLAGGQDQNLGVRPTRPTLRLSLLKSVLLTRWESEVYHAASDTSPPRTLC